MQRKIIRILKSEAGSSLAFVIIIGMVIMILVAALLVVANGEFAFTQETLESRQAYIDAKSVIEFGKIEINSRTTALNNKNNELTALYLQYKTEMEKTDPDTGAISLLKGKIDTAEAQRTVLIDALSSEFVIYGNVKNATETLTSVKTAAPEDADLVKLGELKYDTAKNQFRIETDRANLSRNLDYKVGFNYVASTKTETTTGSALVTPPLPTYNGSILTHFSPWNKGQIYCDTVSGKKVDYKVFGKFAGLNNDQAVVENVNKVLILNFPDANLEVDNDISWAEARTLNLKAHNICMDKSFDPSDCSSASNGDGVSNFNMTAVAKMDPITNKMVPGDIYFAAGYTPDNQGTNTLTAEGGNVVINGNLSLAVNSTVNITCKNLFISGSVNLAPSDSRLNITAENIVVTGGITLSSGTSIVTNCSNIWIGGTITTEASGAKLAFSNVKYLKTGDIVLNDKAELTVTGVSGRTSQMISGIIKPAVANTYSALKVDITNLASFICNGFTLDGNSTLNLSSNAIQILKVVNGANGDLSLKSLSGTNTIQTQYFICEGQTSIVNNSSWQRILNIISMDSAKAFNVRFVGKYTQENAVVNINNADNIYFDNGFTREHDGIINYPTNKTTPTNVYIGASSSYKDAGWESIVVNAGNYIAKGSTPGNYWLEWQGGYNAPVWPAAPNTTGGTIVDVTTGNAGLKSDSEIYY